MASVGYIYRIHVILQTPDDPFMVEDVCIYGGNLDFALARLRFQARQERVKILKIIRTEKIVAGWKGEKRNGTG